MRLGVIVGSVTSTLKHEAYRGRPLLLVQRIDTDGKKLGFPTAAIDYVGAGANDVVLLSAAPGLASTVLGVKKAPVQQLIMGIVDDVEFGDTKMDIQHLPVQ